MGKPQGCFQAQLGLIFGTQSCQEQVNGPVLFQEGQKEGDKVDAGKRVTVPSLSLEKVSREAIRKHY